MVPIQSLDEFYSLISDNDVAVLLVKTNGCSVCDAVEQQLEDGAVEDPEVPAARIKLEDVPEFSGEYLVFSAPTVLLFIEGKEYWRGSRFVRFDEMNQMISSYKAE
ncbi:thioredoxin family protein [Salisediminibacterium halotolerans]|uniref:thioredoxin family protein n=1 Tax=Salisediminibacterium halotolerans TaxID=517425 RepID=UPI000EAD56F9|nr:thioredoxin family protein [Salisediminibacterium halotolerans]RLJ69291.1 thioredoxin-like protein [Actinophytocola xinjiangensis]RPE86974.1 thioredoxin-like protein [Salisediminibacterium halotolerans]TWG32293.1 thioredoxin-like protein [Salisediminibacterium halotolerans]GEL08812.1 thiol reductase thioredoxin [Salisediminibacterium halotolerans]